MSPKLCTRLVTVLQEYKRKKKNLKVKFGVKVFLLSSLDLLSHCTTIKERVVETLYSCGNLVLITMHSSIVIKYPGIRLTHAAGLLLKSLKKQELEF